MSYGVLALFVLGGVLIALLTEKGMWCTRRENKRAHQKAMAAADKLEEAVHRLETDSRKK